KPVEGTATITVSYGNVKAQCTVKVIDKINYAEVIVPVIEKTGNFANNANISEVRKGNIPIPTGYTYVKGAVNGGAVIKDGSGNEWVWIPATVSEISEVVNGKNVGKLYAFSSTGATAKDYPTTSNSGGREPDIVSGYDSSNSSIVLETEKYDTFLEQLQAEFDNMIESVRLYGGYYIGRYEAGGTISSPVLKQGATVITNSSDTSNWYYMYNSAKKLAANSSVTTGMIWGCQWDNTLRWLVSSGNRTWEELVDSKTWGNYDNSSGDADITGHGSPQEAGYSEYWKAGNIYDLAGNYYDWTLEANNTLYRVFRGGYCDLGSDVYPASNRNNRFYPTDAYGNGTFRPTLIIE
ncbi:MAG: hypothetical protein IJ272_00795, partial [Clostridia bacterium]|nr:hypothetical protein [Clostridia bacterium]